jgi:hypothetical protein
MPSFVTAFITMVPYMLWNSLIQRGATGNIYIKSPGLPIIEEAQTSQYAYLVEPDLVSIYTVTAPLSPVSPSAQPTSPPFPGFQNRLRAINREKPARVRDYSFCIRRIGRKPRNPCGRGDLPGDFRRSNPAALLQSPSIGARLKSHCFPEKFQVIQLEIHRGFRRFLKHFLSI